MTPSKGLFRLADISKLFETAFGRNGAARTDGSWFSDNADPNIGLEVIAKDSDSSEAWSGGGTDFKLTFRDKNGEGFIARSNTTDDDGGATEFEGITGPEGTYIECDRVNFIYVAMMDNGSEDMMIRGLFLDAKKAKQRLQKEFLEWRKDLEDLDELYSDGALKDPNDPTLEEMNRISGGANIVAVPEGVKLYEQLREFDFDGCIYLEDNDVRLA